MSKGTKVTFSMIEQSSALLPASGYGGYPLLYVTDNGGGLCVKCATESLVNPEEAEKFKPAVVDAYWEGSPIDCDGFDCQNKIESAYGNPEEDNE